MRKNTLLMLVPQCSGSREGNVLVEITSHKNNTKRIAVVCYNLRTMIGLCFDGYNCWKKNVDRLSGGDLDVPSVREEIIYSIIRIHYICLIHYLILKSIFHNSVVLWDFFVTHSFACYTNN